ncbi:hypothetical protein AX16_004748 [Volvariella volvacea WC 439]|nr:hypothetical protein AX16_004748 [Volvariella volvacea WC 439]
MPSALLLGATGQTGQHILKELLESQYFTRVGEYGRKVTSTDKIATGKEKLEQKQIDFENLGAANLAAGKWDVVFIALGTTRKTAGSAEAFEKIDREYVINVARAARWESPTQRVVYISSVGADPNSSMLYTKSKGLTELGLAGLGYSDTIIFRPAFLVGTQRSETRVFETIVTTFTSALSYISSNVEIKVSTLARAVVLAGKLGTAALPEIAKATAAGKEGAKFTLIGNAGALGMAKLPADYSP